MANILKVDHETAVAAVALSDKVYKRTMRRSGLNSGNAQIKAESFAESVVRESFGFGIADLFKTV